MDISKELDFEAPGIYWSTVTPRRQQSSTGLKNSESRSQVALQYRHGGNIQGNHLTSYPDEPKREALESPLEADEVEEPRILASKYDRPPTFTGYKEAKATSTARRIGQQVRMGPMKDSCM